MPIYVNFKTNESIYYFFLNNKFILFSSSTPSPLLDATSRKHFQEPKPI